jgi:hypothetical protein
MQFVAGDGCRFLDCHIDQSTEAGSWKAGKYWDTHSTEIALGTPTRRNAAVDPFVVSMPCQWTRATKDLVSAKITEK